MHTKMTLGQIFLQNVWVKSFWNISTKWSEICKEDNLHAEGLLLINT